MGKQYVLGIDFGTSGVRAGIFDLHGNEVMFQDEPYELLIPRQGYAEQRVEDWWDALCIATRRAIDVSGIDAGDIIGIGTDTTACTLVFLDEKLQPLQNAIMWMDIRAADQAVRASKTGHPVLKYTGFGNVSAEWMPHKTLWVKENRPEVYAKTRYILECDDWLGYRLTGRIVKNMNDASTRWYYDSRNGGWQEDFFATLGLDDVMEKIPREVKQLGELLGPLCKEAAQDLGLQEGTPVAVGGADAYVAMLGMGVVREGSIALITGSSHLHLFLTKQEMHAKGIFGSFPDAVVSGLNLVEGGQVSTGSIINWYKKNFCGDVVQATQMAGESVYDVFNREAEKLPVGSDGLICLDYFQGNRTPYVDGEVCGLVSGLSLMHTPFHIYKALVESVCYGSELIFRIMREQGVSFTDVAVCGGAVKSRFWMQTHADVSNVNINILRVNEAPTLGAAILGSVAGGAYDNMVTASDNMVEIVDSIAPDVERHEEYQFYVEKYAALYPMMNEWMHEVVRHERRK